MVDDEPGTWRVSDGSRVSWDEALDGWVDAADRYLRDKATEYGAFVTYKELAEHVQEVTGVRTRSLLQNWIGKILNPLAASQPAGEPLLTSLVVTTTDHTVGQGYSDPVFAAEGTTPDDLQRHAAQTRWECYRHFGAEMPADGGSPQLPPRVRAARAKAAPAPIREVCPGCRMQKSLSGSCDCV
ncbi:hypothetical protein [Iamia sp. SCSIO 61187]|uniref:hypothetical protein n=1 Tax=Iamia sp. SCSIO 61187 TaxID=2722752 RepID=UPI002103117D|nr:hypothetical protein [Iamia sp. SCSIO 61187]